MDVSQGAYSATVYIRIEYTVSMNLIEAKTTCTVAPLQSVSIPGLEMIGLVWEIK